MPELPEVEVVRRGLEQHIVGRQVQDIRVLEIRSLRRHIAGPQDFVDRVTGRVVTGVRRRGKFLWMTLDSSESIVGHLGMSGQMLISAVGTARPRHSRVEFTFDEGIELRFVDQRIFGYLMVSEDSGSVPLPIGHIAPDPLETAFDEAEFAARLLSKKTGIKRALLDQSLISGVGNIYADESLWRSRVHYARSTRDLQRVEIAELVGNIQNVMREALEQGGTSFDALYVNVNGQSGYFDRSLAVYGQEGMPCERCGTTIQRDRFMNRSSFFCPRCQDPQRSAHDNLHR